MEKEKKKLPIKVPPWPFRIGIYLLMILFAALALYQVAANRFHVGIGIIFYSLAGVMIFPGILYLTLDIIHLVKRGKGREHTVSSNRYIACLQTDARRRAMIFAVPGTMSNIIFALFNITIGIYSWSAWFICLAAYYILLAVMRGLIFAQERELIKIKEPKRRWGRECDVYRRNSILLILMSFVLVAMVFMMSSSMRGKQYPGIAIYVVAAYTFYKIIKSTIHVIRARRQKSPLLETLRRIGHVDSCVSILNLQTALFAAFGAGQDQLIHLMNIDWNSRLSDCFVYRN